MSPTKVTMFNVQEQFNYTIFDILKSSMYNIANCGGIMKTMEYYFDLSKEAYNYIMSSNILRNRDKEILTDFINGKKTKEIAVDRNCSYRTLCTRRKEIFEKTKCFM